MHTGKPKKVMVSANQEDIFLITTVLKEALRRPGSPEQSFVWQDKTETTPSIVKGVLAKAPNFVEPTKRRKFMKAVLHYAQIGRTKVFNAAAPRDQDAEKVHWNNHVRECLCMPTTLQLVTERPKSLPEIACVDLLHHSIASPRVFSVSITQSRRVAVDKRFQVDRPGSTPLFIGTELKLLKHKETLHN